MWREWMEGLISFIRDYHYVGYAADDEELVLAPDDSDHHTKTANDE